MSQKVKKIALEEHFSTPELAQYNPGITEMMGADSYKFFGQRLMEFELRLEDMDKNGIDMSILSVTTPGVQAEPDAAVATRRAHDVNDFLAGVIQKHPTRFGGFAHLALQDPTGAADELERAVTELGMKGALINGQTNGEYLDDQKFWPMWERAEALGVPIYLHPGNALRTSPANDGYVELSGPGWAWGPETAAHTLRLVYGGVFDRFPKTILILGHMGEALPFMFWRMDSRYAVMRHGKPLQKMPSQYIRDNIMITTSGSFSMSPLLCSMLEIGSDRIMFSVDYPFEKTEEAVAFIDNAPISQVDREKICHLNVERLLKLNG